jgi:large subunit ribosomal protein L24e
MIVIRRFIVIPSYRSRIHLFYCISQFIFLLQSTAELCALSEYRIYPGNGKLMIRRDGKPIFLGSSKAYSLTIQRKKAAKLVWTQAWRRLHKKGILETSNKKRARRANKVQRAVVGASLEEIKKKASQKSDFRAAQRDAALKEVKDRKTANKAKTTSKTALPKGSAFQKVPKHMGGSGRRATTQR